MSTFVMLKRGEVAEELILHHPNAFLLLTLIALRARRTPNMIRNLDVCECHLGDFKACGLTRQQYRTAQTILEKLNFATFCPTNKGTIAKIINTDIYDINPEGGNQQDNHQATIKQPSANHQLTTNNNVKKENNEKNVNKLKAHMDKKIQENKLQKHESKLLEFVDYRNTIKKPLKSKQGITGFINLAKKLNDMRLDVDKCFDYTMGKEWLSPPMEFFTKNKKDFKKEIETISICLDSNTWIESKYQAGGLYKTSEINYINFVPDFIDDDEREEVEANTARFVAEFCEVKF